MVLKMEDIEEIMKAVKVAFTQIYGTQKEYERKEVLITAEQLAEKFPCFSKNWLRRYGYVLPRVRVKKWEDENCKDRWGYCWNKIQKEINEGKYRNLKLFTQIG